MLNWFRGMLKKNDESKPEKAPTSDDRVECNSCGYVGTMADFLKRDPTDTFCPVCGEDDELTFEV